MSVLIYTESNEGKFKKVAFEIASYAKKVADMLGTTVTAVSINATENNALSAYGVSTVLKVTNDKLTSFSAKAYADVIKQAAEKTVDAAGDGTTTSTVLAHSIATQALEATSYASTNATQIKKGIEQAVKAVVAELKEMSVPVSDETQIKQIATLSANGDIEIELEGS